jgi:hypothetical protein
MQLAPLAASQTAELRLVGAAVEALSSKVDLIQTTCATAEQVKELSTSLAALGGTLSRIVGGCAYIAGHAATLAPAGGSGADNQLPPPLQQQQPLALLPGGGEPPPPPPPPAVRPFATLEAVGKVPRLWEEWTVGLGPGSTAVQTYATDYDARAAACKLAGWSAKVCHARAVRPCGHARADS